MDSVCHEAAHPFWPSFFLAETPQISKRKASAVALDTNVGYMEVLYERFRAANDPILLRKETLAERQQLLWREKALELQS